MEITKSILGSRELENILVAVTVEVLRDFPLGAVERVSLGRRTRILKSSVEPGII